MGKSLPSHQLAGGTPAKATAIPSGPSSTGCGASLPKTGGKPWMLKLTDNRNAALERKLS